MNGVLMEWWERGGVFRLLAGEEKMVGDGTGDSGMKIG